MSFSSLTLDKSLTDAVKALGYEQPTPIQQQAIPAILANKDIMACLLYTSDAADE